MIRVAMLAAAALTVAACAGRAPPPQPHPVERAERVICGQGGMTDAEREAYYGQIRSEWSVYCKAVRARRPVDVPAGDDGKDERVRPSGW